MIESNVAGMAVGQVWMSNDKRDSRHPKRVVEVTGNGIQGEAILEPVGGGRKARVQCDKFLKRQGTRSGYSLVE